MKGMALGIQNRRVSNLVLLKPRERKRHVKEWLFIAAINNPLQEVGCLSDILQHRMQAAYDSSKDSEHFRLGIRSGNQSFWENNYKISSIP